MYHYFTPHPEELVDESVASTSAGIFGNLFSRIFKPSKDITIANNARDTTTMSISSSESFKTFDPPRHDDKMKLVTLVEIQRMEIAVIFWNRGKDSSDILEQRKRSYIRFASIFKARNPGLLDYERSNFRRYWMPDSSGRECYECQERFTAFRRRHHCRLCGQIFCSKCCESKLEDEPSSSAFDQKLNYETDVSVSTIFQGPVSWSLNSPIIADENNENGTSFRCAVPRKSSVKLDTPTQLSVTELAIYNSNVQYSATHDVGDDLEPEWVKNIEMTDNVKPLDSSNLKLESMDYSHSTSQKDDMNIENRSNFHVAELDNEQIVRKASPSKAENDDLRFNETIERCFEIQSEKLILQLFNREGLDPKEWWEIIWSVSHVVSSMVKVDMEGRKN
ncbi:unnamed protein product, partial [Wuchereria bancrofti]